MYLKCDSLRKFGTGLQNRSFIFLSTLLFVFLSASLIDSRFEQNTAWAQKKQTSELNAKKATKKKKRVVRRRRRRRPPAEKPTESFKGALGLNINDGQSSLVIAGDYYAPVTMLLKTWPKWLYLVAGGNYWGVDGSTVFTAEGGPDAFFKLNKRFSIYGGLRLSYSYIGGNTSVTKLYLTPGVGSEFFISKSAGSIGGELKLPLADRIGGIYALGTYRFQF